MQKLSIVKRNVRTHVPDTFASQKERKTGVFIILDFKQNELCNSPSQNKLIK